MRDFYSGTLRFHGRFMGRLRPCRDQAPPIPVGTYEQERAICPEGGLELPRSHGQFSAGNCQPLMRPQQGSRRDLVAWSISVHRTLIDPRLATARRSADEHLLMTAVHVTPSSGIPRAGGALQSDREIKASKPRRAWQRAGNEVAPLPDGLDAVVERSTQEHVGRLQDGHDVASEAHVARMLPPTRLLCEQR